MKHDRRFFIGYDSARPEPYFVCKQSLVDVGVDPSIIVPLILPDLEAAGFYWRNDAHIRSTEFTNSRFLVPFLSGFYGTSIFCDADFLWRSDPTILFELAEADQSYAVRVVQHDVKKEDLKPCKMDGKIQSWYPRKNWSSLMVFNNGHEDCLKLTPQFINGATISTLHQFQWTGFTPRLPTTFNYLVGYERQEVKNPVAVHFTDGGPWLKEYQDVDYAQEWFDVQRRTQYT